MEESFVQMADRAATDKNHIVYTDVLRVVALLAVIMIHVSSYMMEDPSVPAERLGIMQAWDNTASWAVPLFVMISGVFFTDPERPVSYRRIWKHNIPRIVTAFAGWSLFYAVYTVILSPQKDDFSTFLTEFIKGHYHMWYLFMIVGLYITVPVVRKITEDRRVLRLFLVIAGVTGFLLPGLRRGIAFLEETGTADYAGANVVHQLLDSMDQVYEYSSFGYMLFYFAAGWFFSGIVVRGRRRLLLILVLGFCACVNVTAAVPGWTVSEFLHETEWLIPVCAVCIFLLGRSLEGSRFFAKHREGFAKLGKWTFGAYLSHAAVIEFLASPVGLTSMTFQTAVSIPVIVILVCMISMAVSAVMARIPFLRRFV